ncbi:MAG: SprT family zinc-dependent metalloprotease [Thermoanaerobaculia bacterium]
MPTLAVGEARIPYRMRWSRRARRLQVVVEPGGVEVVVPRRVGQREAEAFLRESREWVRRRYEALRQPDLLTLPDRFVSGARVPFHGRRMPLTVERAAVSEAELTYARAFRVRVPWRLTAEEREAEARRMVLEYMARRALADAEAMVELYAPELGVRPRGLRVRRTKSQWGSCGVDDVLNFNWLLVALPKPIFEYIVVHELCHLRVRDHSRRFWRVVAEVMPDYEERRAWLSRHGVGLA